MKRKRFMKTAGLIMLVTAIMTSVMAPAAAAGEVLAAPTPSTVMINGKPVAFEAYLINGNNYFKLRDLAMAFMGTAKRFSVEWDGGAKAVRLQSGQIYSPDGKELKVSGSTSAVKAVPSSDVVYLDGRQIYAKAYRINDNNYFKLRDIAAAMDFSVTYDKLKQDVKIDTNKGYYLDAVAEILEGSLYLEGSTNVFFNKMDSGSITITRQSNTFYSIEAENISENGMATLRSVVGIFTTDPDQVVKAVTASKSEGQKILQIEDKTFTCTAFGQKYTVNVSW